MELTKQIVRVGFGVMMLRGGKVLLGKRHDDPMKADSELHGEGTWTMPGGKLEFGETFEQGVVREVSEETSMYAKSFELICVANDRGDVSHFVTLGFLCKEFEGDPKVMEPDEITEWRWFSFDAFPDRMFVPSREIIDNYLARRFYTKFDAHTDL